MSILSASAALMARDSRSELAECSAWSWQEVVRRHVNDPLMLAELLQLDESRMLDTVGDSGFDFRVPLTFVRQMQAGNWQDPLLLQVLNRREEQQVVPGYVPDPLAEHTGQATPGVIQKYQGRVLLTASVSCPIHCRYCFRRHFPYAQNRLTPATWDAATAHIAADPSIQEVILSGGEPLMLPDAVLTNLLERLERIEHVRIVRLHTRFPSSVPQRLTSALIDRLQRSRCQVVMVLHINHAQEISDALRSRLQALVNSPVTLLSQTVLLREVNDSVDVLESLCRTLFDSGILPYYLHLLDPVSGTAHMDTGTAHAQALLQQLTNRLPGYLVPTLVREEPHQPSKMRIAIHPT